MSVYPDGSRPVPDDVKTVSTSVALQDLTEDKIRGQIRAKHLPPWSQVGTSMRSVLAGVVNLFGSAMLGSWNRVDPAAISIEDGQLRLNGRTDLLDGVRGYASAYQSLNVTTGAGYVFNGFKWRFLPFRSPLGPSKGARVVEQGGIVIDEPGLWTVSVTIAKEQSGGLNALLNDTVVMDAFVSDSPWVGNGEPPSEILLTRLRSQDSTIIGDRQTVSVSFPVVVDTPGCFVGVRAATISETWFKGGTLFSRLSVVKHDNRPVNPGVSTVPNE